MFFHTGQWECSIESNYSHDSRRVNLTVLDENTQYCDGELEANDYGAFKWPEVVTGARISLDCGFRAKQEASALSISGKICALLSLFVE